MPPRRLSTPKLIAALTAALTVLGGGGITTWNGYSELKAQTNAAMEGVRELKANYAAWRESLQKLEREASSNGSKLDMLIQMFRDHTAHDEDATVKS